MEGEKGSIVTLDSFKKFRFMWMYANTKALLANIVKVFHLKQYSALPLPQIQNSYEDAVAVTFT